MTEDFLRNVRLAASYCLEDFLRRTVNSVGIGVFREKEMFQRVLFIFCHRAKKLLIGLAITTATAQYPGEFFTGSAKHHANIPFCHIKHCGDLGARVTFY